MTPPGPGYRVAVVGASSLLGKELLAVLRERRFPLSNLVEIEATGPQSAPELPILDLDDSEPSLDVSPEVGGGDLDLAFVASGAGTPPRFMRPECARPSALIDLDASLAELSHEAPRIALLDPAPALRPESGASQSFASAHPATIIIAVLLLRLAARTELSRAVAHLFSPASSLGPRAIEELQRQTVNLLGFQTIPRAVFGAQLAFNLLPGISGSGSAAHGAIGTRVQGELGRYLAGRTPPPAVQTLRAPVFYSMAVSLYVETAAALTPAQAAAALAGKGVRFRRASEGAPSPVDVTGSADIALGPVLADASSETGLWIWAAADDLRLAAQNAVEIGVQLTSPAGARPPAGARRKAR